MDAYDKGSTARRSDLEPQPGPEPGPSRSPVPNQVPEPSREPEPSYESDPSHEPELSHEPDPDPASPPLAPPPAAAAPRVGLSALSLRYQIAAACALVVIALGACVHVAMVFLHVSPPNTLSKEYSGSVDSWIYPEFEQNWKLFAPNPLQQNIAVQARAEIRTADGGTRTTGWYDLSAQDGADIDGNLLPSHTQQNELRRAWDFYVSAHDSENRPNGVRGQLSERYIRRIVVLRLSHDDGLTAGGKAAAGEKATIARVQVRSRTTNVVPPPWSDEKVDSKPVYREVPWWTVTVADRALASNSNSKSESRNGTGTRARAATDGTDAR
ncbi:DUF5819 family protein [Streptomyces sp. NBC_01445]|uniref:DUF5819 family protein n=1 Tax=Streptomyces sp. NBC_01445 TaxID=2903869 RepID=UPI002DD906A0|nr:DUF5819 family protein [Streptomyces sp. NBC_01445]WSE06167.1 DUF5819 family protein [Streptomyces sp. NBC_01445]